MSVRTSAKAVIIEDGRLLAIRCVDPLTGDEFFLLPGGGQERGEPIHATLVRECIEETGCVVDVHELLFVRDYVEANHEFAYRDSGMHQMDLIFRCTVRERGASPSLVDRDQTGIQWLPLDRIEELPLYPGVLRPLLATAARGTLSPGGYLGDVN